jgi:hypothetical protein
MAVWSAMEGQRGEIAMARDMIDLRGTWKGTSQTIVDGASAHHPPVGTRSVKGAAKYRLSEQAFTMVIEGQDGRRIWGTIASRAHVERVIGSLSVDGKQLFLVDHKGYIDGNVVNGDTVEIYYRQVLPGSAVVSGLSMKRSARKRGK